MNLDQRVCDRARRSRDARFDGRFFIAVKTTGIYCRPICPARTPKDENIRYFPTAAAAQAAGFRPCLRCRPEASPGTPAWSGTSGVVSRALRLIGEGALDTDGVERLADRLGVTDRHLRRLFLQHLGATPLEVALTRRIHFAKKLLDETTLPCGEIALAAGFGSVRRFNGEIRKTYSRTPTELRRPARRTETTGGTYHFRLAYRPPYDWDALLAFLAARAIPGVELVERDGYQRTITLDGKRGEIRVTRADTGNALNLEVQFPDPRALLIIVERVRRIFDLGADPSSIASQFGTDRLLRASLRRHPGIRTPGAWDGFELAVRAIVGQQISVKGATTICGRIAAMFGLTPEALMTAPLEQAGLIAARANAIRELAKRVANGSIQFSSIGDPAIVIDALQSIPGIGAWTAQYVAMRALGEPDAFPSGDVVLQRMALRLGAAAPRSGQAGVTARELDRLAEAWRPWRSYAVMLLWQSATDEQKNVGHRFSGAGENQHAMVSGRNRARASDGISLDRAEQSRRTNAAG